MLLTISTKAEGALFNNQEANKEGNEHQPMMRGVINVGEENLNVAAFHRVSKENGTPYLSLTFSYPNDVEKEKPIWYGKLFKQVGKDKAVSYYGFLDLIPHAFNVATSKYDPMDQTQGEHSGLPDAAPQLRLKGKRAVSNDEKTHYIKLSVFPASKRSVDNNEEKDALAF